MANEQENKKQEIYGSELEEDSAELAEKVKATYTGSVSEDMEKILCVLCSIAISLKKLAEEANTITSNLRYDK